MPRSPFYSTIASILLAATLTVSSGIARASDPFHSTDVFLSGTGNVGYLSAGVLLPLFEDGHNGEEHALRAADALGTSVIFSEGLKYIFKEERPDHSGDDSFPSGHATAAFAIATMESADHPRQSIFWFAGAAAIGASRVGLHRHYIHDVIAGALLGYGTARWELSEPHGLILEPFITREGGGHATGLQVSASF